MMTLKSSEVKTLRLLLYFCDYVYYVLDSYLTLQRISAIHSETLWPCIATWKQVHLPVYAKDAITLARLWVQCS